MMSWLSRIALIGAVILVMASGLTFADRSDGSDDTGRASVPVESTTDKEIGRLQARLKVNGEDEAGLVQLGFAFLQKSRENMDSSLFPKAQDAFQRALQLAPADQQALIGLSSVALFKHDFAGARQFADQALAIGQPIPAAYGALGDSLMELGRYQEAIGAYQKMADLRPDLNAYARVSYARELQGDVPGAIEAMRMAVEAAGFKGETSAWTHWQLGNLYFNTGDVAAADREYSAAIESFPGYAPAIAAGARVAASRGDYASAEKMYLDATGRAPVLMNIAALGDVFLLDGKKAEAQRQFDLVGAIAQLYRTNGVRTDLELALFYADHDLNQEEAVNQALAAYHAAPSVPSADVLAWSLLKAGRAPEALPYAQQALAQGTQDASIFHHLGMIQKRLGNNDAAHDALSRALAINPHFSLLQAPLARQALEEVGS